MSEIEAKFRAGDVVQVVDRPNTANAFSWVGSMNEFCGQIVTIKQATTNHWLPGNLVGYRIEEDNDGFLFDEYCFLEVNDLSVNNPDLELEDLSVLYG